METIDVEEATGGVGVLGSNLPVTVIAADGNSALVGALGIFVPGAKVQPSWVLIDGGPQAMGWTGEGEGQI